MHTITTPTGTITVDYQVDRHGFPIVTCDRCNGVGTIAAHMRVFNGECFKCRGARAVSPTPAVAKIASAFYARIKGAGTCHPLTWITFAADGTAAKTVEGVIPGDRIRRGPAEAWRTVASVRPTARLVGEGYAGDRLIHLTLETMIVFTDGTRATSWGGNWDREKDFAAFARMRDVEAAKAREAYERTLARRAKNHARRTGARRDAAEPAEGPPVVGDIPVWMS